MKKYRLERRVDGEWYAWGTYTDPVKLAKAANELGVMGFDLVRVVVLDE